MELQKENSDLRDATKLNAETLQETLRANQILNEELKVKNAIIEADKMLKNSETTSKKCTECNYSTNISKHMKGHMTKHVAEYRCPHCEELCESDAELKAHTNYEHNTIKKVACNKCDRKFQTEIS